MAGKFSNRKKLIMLSAAIEEKMPYIKKATSLFSQGEVAKKKYGHQLTGYLPDSGSVSDGLVAHPDKAHQVEVSCYIKNKNTAVEYDMFDEILNIDDFKREIVEKRAGKLAREVQLSVMGENVFRSCQAYVASAPSFAMLSKSAAMLDELSVAGDRVDFQVPTLLSTIAESGLAKYIPTERMTKIYDESYLGQYGTAAQVNLPGLPIVDTTGMDAAPTISAEVVKDASNNVIGLKPINTITGSGTGTVKVGIPYKVSGLKIVDASGIETNQDYVLILNKETRFDSDGNASDVTYLPQLRVTVDSKAYGNPNAHIDATTLAAATADGVATLTLTPMLTASKHYQVGQVRTINSLSWDQYRFEDLPAAKQDSVGTFENITLKMQSAPEVLNGVAYLRIDLPYASKLMLPWESVTTYTLLD